MKALEDLTFIDDYMFGEVMKNKEICKEVIERLTHLKIRSIEYPELQKTLKAGYESHGVRLDVYVKDSNKVYDIEMQNRSYDDLGKRTRFYQSLIDADCLLRGMDYKKLPESIIIFICKNDPFDAGLQKYTFRATCEESGSVNLHDKSLKLIYNASAWEKEVEPEIKAFLQFVSRNRPSDDFTDGLLKSVAEVKRNEFFRKEYLSMGVWETDIRHEAIREGLEQGIRQGIQQGIHQGEQKKAVDTALNFLKENIAPEIIARCCSLPIDEVNRLAMELKKETLHSNHLS